jgi:Ca2+-binding EF-hand superfamily protein
MEHTPEEFSSFRSDGSYGRFKIETENDVIISNRNKKLTADNIYHLINEDPNAKKRLENIVSYLKVEKQSYIDDDLDKVFKSLDVDGDHKITSKEIKRFLNALKTPTNDFHIKRMINDFDKNGDGEIEKDEFILRMNEQKHYGKKDDLNELLEIFKLFDVNADKKITGQDLYNIMKAIGENFSESYCNEMVRLLSDEKGYLDFAKFFDIVKDERNKNIYN